jgi:predicted O-methyltransferase YrrM
MSAFSEEWFGPESQHALADLYDKVRDLDGDVVEVGCWEGRSTIALANACHPTIVHAVDTWEGSPGEISWDLAHERDVAYQFAVNIENHTAGNVQAHRMGWRDYFAEIDRPLKFLHVDAEHTYREVFDNITAALPLLVPGGIICGDDVHHPPIQQAVLATLGPATNVVATLWWWQKC